MKKWRCLGGFWDLGLRPPSPGFEVEDVGFTVWTERFRIKGLGLGIRSKISGCSKGFLLRAVILGLSRSLNKSLGSIFGEYVTLATKQESVKQLNRARYYGRCATSGILGEAAMPLQASRMLVQYPAIELYNVCWQAAEWTLLVISGYVSLTPLRCPLAALYGVVEDR